MNKKILHLALPSIVSNITVPLLGLVDTAIVGHMGESSYIGAIAVGSMVFNVTYWLFSFLRMGTGGLTAQAFGRKDMDYASKTGIRSLLISSLIGAVIIALQLPLFSFMLWVIAPEGYVLELVWRYCSICVWGAPASLALFALNGWFVGMQNTRIPMIISIMQNVVNILVSLLLVYVLGWKIGGVATGTLIAQWTGALVGGIFFIRKCPSLSMNGVARIEDMKKFFTVNRDIFLRTLFLVAVNLFFVSAGAKGGTIILAVNTLLMQLFILYSYVMDGFAYAAEALCGRYYGARDKVSLKKAIGGVMIWSIGLTLAYTLVYAFGGSDFLSLLTDNKVVIHVSEAYLPWAWAIPFAGLLAFVWDGVFIGMTMTRGMLLGTSSAAVMFFITYHALSPTLENHALWLAFILFLLTRGFSQSIYFSKKNIFKQL